MVEGAGVSLDFTLFRDISGELYFCFLGIWKRRRGVICCEWHNGIGWYIVGRGPLILE